MLVPTPLLCAAQPKSLPFSEGGHKDPNIRGEEGRTTHCLLGVCASLGAVRLQLGPLAPRLLLGLWSSAGGALTTRTPVLFTVLCPCADVPVNGQVWRFQLTSSGSSTDLGRLGLGKKQIGQDAALAPDSC